MNRVFGVVERAWMVLVHIAVLIGLFCCNAWLIYTNFTALKVSFDLSKYDATPVGSDLLTGWLWDSLGLYELTQAHMIAAAVAIGVGFLSGLSFHLIYTTAIIILQKREYAKNNDNTSLELANTAIIRNLIRLGLVLIVLVPIAYWDLQLFRFRTAAPILGMEDNAVTMKNWSLLLQQHGDLFAMSLAKIGGWAYIALIAGFGLLMEIWINYVREALVRLGAEIDGWNEYITGNENADATRPQAMQTQEAVTVAASDPPPKSATKCRGR